MYPCVYVWLLYTSTLDVKRNVETKVIYMHHKGGTLCFSYIENLGKLSEMWKRAHDKVT